MAAKISDLINLAPWTPLKEISSSPKEIDVNIFALSDNIFAIAQPYNRDFISGLPDAPFVTMIYWAVSADAVSYCFSKKEIRFCFDAKAPPPELLLRTSGQYGDIVRLAGPLGERAIYNGVTGSFVHRVISVGKYRFFFIGELIDNQQMSYAIEFKL